MPPARARTLLRPLVLLLLAATGFAPAATAAVFPSDAAVSEAARYRGWEVTSFAVTGLDGPLAEELRDGLVLDGQRGLLRTRRPPLFQGTLADDLKRARVFLAQRGYPWARIGVEFRPERRSRKLGVTFTVAPGTAVVIDSLAVTGVPAYVEDAAAARGAPLRAGARFTEADLSSAKDALTGALAAAGHPRAAVTPQVSLADSARAQVVLAAQPGPRCIFAGTVVTGAPDDLRGLVLCNAEPPAGGLFTPAALHRARRNVRELDLFRRIDVAVSDPRDGEVDLLVELVPRKPRSAEVQVGYWTDDFLRAGARWRHRNLLRGGRGAEVKGYLSRFRRDGSLNVWWLSPFGPRTRLTTRLHYAMELEDGYNLTSRQAEVWAARRVGGSGELQAGVTVADISLEVTTADTSAFLAESGLLTSLHLRANLDRVDDPIDPTRGVSWSGRIEWSPPWLPSDNNFASGTTSIAWYRPLAGAVLATRLETGLARPLGDSRDLLPNKRFFAGGATSMRGAKRRRLGPLDSDGSPVGGEVLLIGSAELRIPLKGLLRTVLFVDAGNVWRRAADASLGDLAVAAGPGLMIETPVGPVRTDAGFNLTARPPGEPDVVIHLSVGHPF